MTSNQEFKRLARRVKLRRWGMTILIAGVVCLGLGFLTVQTLNALTRKASDRDNAFMSDVAEIVAPNIQISDQYLVNNKLFSGQILSHRYKDIEGKRVAWSPMTADYSWAQGGHLPTALNATDEQGARVYDRVTQQKVPVFYNVARKRQAGQLTGSHPLQELGQVERTKGQVAEVALTFQHPLTYRQIQQRLPQGVHAAWYWLGVSGKADTTVMANNFVGLQAGNARGRLTQQDYRAFRDVARTASHQATAAGFTLNGFAPFKYAGQYVQRYPQLTTARFAGVIVTGTSAHLKQLGTPSWVAASAAGVVTPQTTVK